jgi:hypothetical protein
MKRTTLAVLTFAGAAEALAHPSTVAHEHPHGVSALPGVDLVVVAVVVAALATIALGKLLKRW